MRTTILKPLWAVIRYCYAFFMGVIFFRHELGVIMAGGKITPEDINANGWLGHMACGIRVVVFDWDGILSAQGEISPNEHGEIMLRSAAERFGANKVFILSNSPKPERAAHIQTNYEGITFIDGVRKKPYPDGLNKIIKESGCEPDQILMIDDGALTGCLAALLVGARACWVRNPYRNYQRHWLKEQFFRFVRSLERAIFELN